MMPKMDGIETLGHIKADENSLNINTPVIMLTANAITGAKDDYIKAGFCDYLAKPLNENELKDMLKKYLKEEQVITKKKPKHADSDEAFEMLASKANIDIDTGLGYCLNDMDFYKSVLKEYLTGEKSNYLNECFEKEDWENYRITVHSVKSSSMTIGAVGLSERAKRLEAACRENEINIIKAEHKGFIDTYRKLCKNIRTMCK
jgi:response regulator RpfG family c-di-GMP phosphodiesterase